eukprot:TRINITY_DN5032_c1_g2_i1.p1 TRINITY_DN5032_c1_g2~~TRINITY_DN5032_c1_g2_i1.p1  ORF type:complete len:207 (+),score=24.69 TRINITY_DN5032_c1_g2_i1:146-766(+)
MGKKRKSDATRLDEVDRTMYTTFCSAANSLSQLYTQAMNQQKLAFQAGERHGMEKLYQWILRQHEDGLRVTGADIVTYLQNELDHGGEDTSMSPRMQSQHQHSQPSTNFTNSSVQVSSGSLGQTTVGQAPRPGHSDQTKNSVFSNALSSPVRQSLQPFHLAQGGYYPSSGARIHEANFPQNRESNPPSSNDSSMDMHADSPSHESY